MRKLKVAKVKQTIVPFPNSRRVRERTPDGLQREIEMLEATNKYLLRQLNVEKVMTKRYRNLWSIVIQYLSSDTLALIKSSHLYTNNETQYNTNIEKANRGAYVDT